MARTYEAQSIIELPTVDAGSASAIISALLQLAEQHGKKLSARVVRARDALAGAQETLAAALRASIPAAPSGGTVAEPERAEAAAWTACERWLTGLKTMPSESPLPALAARLYDALFADALRFLRGASHKRWSETQRRLEKIDDERMAADFAALGGKEMLLALRATHRATGDALGFTVPKAPAETPQLRAPFDAAKKATRQYVLQVAASADEEKPETVALAELLLSPLTSYQPPERATPTPTPPADKKDEKSKQDGKKEAGETAPSGP